MKNTLLLGISFLLATCHPCPAQTPAAAPAKVASFVWAYKDFYTFDDAINFMNSLPLDKRARCYVLFLNSARSGPFNGFYTVVYPN